MGSGQDGYVGGCNPPQTGSTPVLPSNTYGNVAQLVERKVEALGVVGSSPAVPTKRHESLDQYQE